MFRILFLPEKQVSTHNSIIFADSNMNAMKYTKIYRR
jgi:hypothetical protein